MLTTGARRGSAALAAFVLAAALTGCSFGSFGEGGGSPGWTPSLNAPPVPAAKPAPPPGMQPRAAQPRPAPAETVVTVPLEASRVEARVSPGKLPTPEKGAPLRYKVQPGDSLYALSRRFGTPIRAIIVANEMSPPYQLTVGETLVIPRPLVHVVQPGDTAYGVSRRYGVDLTEMVRLNDIPPPYTLVPGQRLAMPGGILRASLGENGEPDATTTPEERAQTAAPDPAEPAVAAATSRTAAEPESEAAAPTRQEAALPLPRGSIPQPPPRAEERFLWPLEGQIVARFGSRSDGVHNDGINIAAPRGTPVRAAENGVVAYVGEELRGFGRLLLIKHDDGWVTAYAHNDSILVRRGDTVRRGQVVARVGSSGNVARPQLHFEVRRGTRAVDPLTVLIPAETAAR